MLFGAVYKMKRYASYQNIEETKIKDEFSPDENASPLSTFDVIVGHIEDILIDEEFLKLQRCILEKHCEEFDETEENKLCYTSIFEEYVSIMERYIEQRLKKEIIGFDLEEFYEELHKRRDSLDGEVFEVLYTLSDFIAFKEMILSYKNESLNFYFNQDKFVYEKSICATFCYSRFHQAE